MIKQYIYILLGIIALVFFLSLFVQLSTIWKPPVTISWDWQLGETVDISIDVAVYDIDYKQNKRIIDVLHKRGKKVICYVNVGAWEDFRSDKDAFPKEIIGNVYQGYQNERWLDIRKIHVLEPIMQKRFDICKKKGFDGLEPDNIDGYDNDTGFSLTYQDQIRYNKWIAQEAHKRGLSVGLKNNPQQVKDLEPYFDWAMTEDCYYQSWCEKMTVFSQKGKAVFMAEYTDTGVRFEEFCLLAKKLRFNAMLKNRSLDAFRKTCE